MKYIPVEKLSKIRFVSDENNILERPIDVTNYVTNNFFSIFFHKGFIIADSFEELKAPGLSKFKNLIPCPTSGVVKFDKNSNFPTLLLSRTESPFTKATAKKKEDFTVITTPKLELRSTFLYFEALNHIYIIAGANTLALSHNRLDFDQQDLKKIKELNPDLKIYAGRIVVKMNNSVPVLLENPESYYVPEIDFCKEYMKSLPAPTQEEKEGVLNNLQSADKEATALAINTCVYYNIFTDNFIEEILLNYIINSKNMPTGKNMKYIKALIETYAPVTDITKQFYKRTHGLESYKEKIKIAISSITAKNGCAYQISPEISYKYVNDAIIRELVTNYYSASIGRRLQVTVTPEYFDFTDFSNTLPSYAKALLEDKLRMNCLKVINLKVRFK